MTARYRLTGEVVGVRCYSVRVQGDLESLNRIVDAIRAVEQGQRYALWIIDNETDAHVASVTR